MARTTFGPSTGGASREAVPDRRYVFLPPLVFKVGQAGPGVAGASAHSDGSLEDNLFVVEWQLPPAKADES